MSVHWFEVRSAVFVYPPLFMASVFAVRKLAYQLYRWFPTAQRVCIFGRKREFKFYWSRRADFTSAEVLRLYVLWVLVRIDKYFPIVDCERQAAKAQYFHDEGWYTGMGAFRFRYVNSEAWHVLLVRGLCSLLFPAFFTPSNQVINDFEKRTASDEAQNKPSHGGSIAEVQP
jgi:hypothetical protein